MHGRLFAFIYQLFHCSMICIDEADSRFAFFLFFKKA